MPASGRILFLVHAVVFFSVVFGAATRVQGQAASGVSAQSDAVGATQGSLAAAWSEGVKALAGKIVAGVKPAHAISVEVKNISSLGAGDAEAIRKGLVAELTNAGLRIGAGEADVVVTLSENGEDYVWVAEIRTKTANRVELIQVARRDALWPLREPKTVLLQASSIMSRKGPILDFERRERTSQGRTLTVDTLLVPGLVITSTIVPSQMSEGSYKIKTGSVPRDARGLVIATENDEVRLLVGKDECVGGIYGEPHCRANANPNWPFRNGVAGRFVGNRNYFAGFLNDATDRLNHSAFYSAAIGINKIDGNYPIIATELDGKARLYGYGEASIATFTGWGDDIASINTPCGERWFVLVTGTGDWTQTDRIQVFEISVATSSATARVAGQPLEFPGPIMSMWQSEDGKLARVVSKNLQTGVYEASIVTATCSE